MYSIGQTAELTGVSAYTLRYYEKIGLIKQITRDHNGLRSYNEADINNIRFVKILKETGMTLSVLKDFLDEGCIADDIQQGKDVSVVIKKRLEILDSQIMNLKQKQKEIDKVLDFSLSKKQAYEELLATK